jgi:diacylglycerol kinase family enzyme
LEKLEQKSRRVIGVGKLTFEDQSRWFLFNAGFGIDARVLAKMETRRYKGKRVSDLNYAILAFRELLSEIVKTRPTLVIKNETGMVFDPVQFALIMNFSPWTYVGSSAISPLAKISNTQSLDVFAPKFISLISLARVIKDLVSMRVAITDQQNIVLLGEKFLELSSEVPIWAQVDGEPLVKLTSATVEHFADCLTVLA